MPLSGYISPGGVRRLALTCAWLAAAAPVAAQPKPVDLKERESRLSEKGSSPEQQAVLIHSDFQDKQMMLDRWAPRFSRLNRKPRVRPAENLEFPEVRAKPLYRVPEAGCPDRRSAAQQRMRLAGGDTRRPREEIALLVRDVPVVRINPGLVQYQAMVDQLSLADINRYVFQQNHSHDAGLPAVPAGGGAEPKKDR